MTVKYFLLFVAVYVNYCFTYTPDLTCRRKNEHYECGSACQTTCATLGDVCPIGNNKCVHACYCDEGFARNDYGTCIPEPECFKAPTTDSPQLRNSQDNDKLTTPSRKNARKRRLNFMGITFCSKPFKFINDANTTTFKCKECPGFGFFLGTNKTY
ncbi:uncharacterized protein LOC111349353 [Spodoptera litura]|uniref:Uncharacterized protein LOC111349353 n=1 Tax=Spodoptera litura TaxID=69820 RepID=A0A9J7IIC8_SPOLT|nr:uncharacterized protein LOC111349353 [Spodoptera litura]